MKKSEQQLADELDALLTARQKGRQLPAAEEMPKVEARLAAELLDLAASTKAETTFAARLETRLARIAGRGSDRKSKAKKADPPERQSFWQEFRQTLRRSLTMKRTLFALGAVAAVFVFVFFAWTALNNGGQAGDGPGVADVTATVAEDETVVEALPTAPVVGDEAEENTSPEEPAEPIEAGEPTELALLPRMEASQASGADFGRGGGGGGRGTEGAPAVAAESAIMIAPDFGQAFADAHFVLNATLPTEPTTALVQQRIYKELELVDARRIADQFGFSGPIYTEIINFRQRPLPAVEEPLPETAPAEGEGVAIGRPTKDGAEEFEPPKTYYVFDSERVLNIYSEGVTYINRGIQVDYGAEVANALPIAEAFLQERGLLDFPYVLEQGFSSGEVQVRRLIEGQPLQDPEIFVQVAPNGEVAFASSFQLFGELVPLGNYPLISAEAAWQLILDDVVANNVSFNIVPDEARKSQPVVPPPADMPQYWRREYQPGTEAHIYSWPSAYERADGQGPPLVQVEDLVLNGSDADLQAIADQIGQMFHFWGQIVANDTLQLAGWEVMGEQTPLTLEGNIQWTADQVLLLASDGQTYIIPDAPADLPDGLKVNLFAWASRDAGLAYPVLDWQNIDEWFDYTSEPVLLPEPVITDEEFVDPFSFKEITINEVKLSYQVIFNYENFDKRTRPPEYVQPVWQFNGVTDLGDNIELRVQAVAPEYLQAP